MLTNAIALLCFASHLTFGAPFEGDIEARALPTITQVILQTVTTTAIQTHITNCPVDNPLMNLPTGPLLPSTFSLPPVFSLPSGFSFPGGIIPTALPLPSDFSLPGGLIPTGIIPTGILPHRPTGKTSSAGWPFGLPLPTGFPFGWFKLAERAHAHDGAHVTKTSISHVTVTVALTTTLCSAGGGLPSITGLPLPISA